MRRLLRAPQALSATTDAAESALYGTRPGAVIAAIRERAERRRAGDAVPDGRKIGLVIEGGAMRAVCSAGGAAALAFLGLTDVFDEVYATSAGVMNASYFVSHQPASGIRVYFDHCTTRAFFNPLRFWKVIDVDHLFRDIVTKDKPLRVDRLLASHTKLFVAVVDQQTGEGRVIDVRESGTPVLQLLKASTAIPVLYNKTVEVDGRPSVDGGIAIPFPLEQAIANGCTDVLVLLTRPANYRAQRASWGSRLLFALLCARGVATLNAVYRSRHERVNAIRDLALGRTPPPTSVNIATLCSDPGEIVDRTTNDETALREAALRYGSMVMRVFGADVRAWELSRLTDD